MQREESIESGAGNQVIATNPDEEIFSNYGNRPEQRNNHICSPIRQLAPWQDVTREACCHQHNVDGHSHDPEQFSWSLIGTVHQPFKHMDVDYEKESRSPGGMQIPQHPSVLHIPHDIFNGSECSFSTGGVVHGQPDAREQLHNRYQQCQYTEEIPEIEILRRVVLAHMFLPGCNDRQPGIDPV